MADAKTITVDGTKYNIKDESARNRISTLENSVVYKTGNKAETITGVKTFSSTIKTTGGNEPIRVGDVAIVDGTQSYKDIAVYDTAGKRVGLVRVEHSASNARSIGLNICTTDNANKGGITLSLASDNTTIKATAPAPASTSNDTTIATTKWVRDIIPSVGGVPTGTVTAFAGNAAPSGWLLCNGAAVSRTTYAALFAVIGTTYGAGDGSTTFNVPNGNVAFGTNIPVIGNGALGIVAPIHWNLDKAVYAAATNTDGLNYLYGNGASGKLSITTDGTKSGVVLDTSSLLKTIIKY